MIVRIASNNMIDITDWISAGSDVVMAISALGGLYIAMNWKRTATQNMALQYCITIKDDILPLIEREIKDTFFESAINQIANYLKEPTNINLAIIKKKKEFYDHKMALLGQHYAKLKYEYGKLKNISWKANRKIDKTFNDIINEIPEITSEAFTVSFELELFISMCEDAIESYSTDLKTIKKLKLGTFPYNINNEDYINNIETSLNQIITMKKNLSEKFKELDIENTDIFSLFEPNKKGICKWLN